MPESTPLATLPTADLRNLQVPLEVLKIVPLATAEKFRVAAFAVDERVLKLAVAHPEYLKQGFYVALKDIGKKIGRTVELYKVDSASMQQLVRRYRRLLDQQGKPAAPKDLREEGNAKKDEPPKAAAAPKPPLFELGKTVAYNYLKWVPFDYAKGHRLLCVDYLSPSTYWFVSDRTADSTVKQLARDIEEKNDATVHLIPIGEKDFDDLLGYYEQAKKADEKKRREESQRRAAAPAADAVLQTPAKPVAEGVVMPEVQAKILSQQEEAGGIAGLFQRLGHSLAGSTPREVADAAAEDAPAAAAQPAVPAPAVPAAQPASAAAAPAASAASAAPAASQPSVGITPVSAAAGSGSGDAAAAQSADDGDIGRLLDKPVESLDDLKEHIKRGSIPRIVAAIVNYAIHEKASDIHIEVFEDEVRVRYRIDGQLIDIVKLPPDVHAAVVSRIKILSKLRLDETRVPQDGRFDVKFDNAQVDVRVSVMPTVHGEKVVLRILDKNKGISSLEELGIEGLAYKNILKAIEKPYGICLATGPTGSGKSTTLYAVLQRIATPNVNVVTLEDPVEYEVKGVNQSQVRPKIGFTFAEGLRAVLRQDPNIIMVGEIRDGETANMSTQAALTGHLVLSTLHTNDAAGAIPRLENMGIEPFLIASSVNMVIGQRLVRKICPHCKSQVTLPGGLQEQIARQIDEIAALNPLDAARITRPLTFWQGTGCDACNGKGYLGRIGIFEVLVMTDAIEELTLKRAPATQIQEAAQKEGMLTMYQDGLLKVLAGLTTMDEVLRESANN